MSGENLAVVLYLILSLNKGHNKVADLGYNGNHDTTDCKYEIVCVEAIFGIKEVFDNKSENNHSYRAEYNAADSALDSFLGANLGNKLVLAEEVACEIGKNVGNPGADEAKEVVEVAVLTVADQKDRKEGGDHVKRGKIGYGQLGKRNAAPCKNGNGEEVEHQKNEE